jgi:hypothetical protein
MHLDKNVFDSTISILLNIKKTKDGLKSRTDLFNLGIRDDLHPKPSTLNGKVDLPCAGYNLTIDERRRVVC